MKLSNNFDKVSSAGIADATSLDKFFDKQGSSCFCCMQDVFSDVPSNIEVLHDGEGVRYTHRLIRAINTSSCYNEVLYGDEQSLVRISEDAARGNAQESELL